MFFNILCWSFNSHMYLCMSIFYLQCGNKTQVFTKSCNACSYQNRLTCPLCKLRGHSLDYCPDKWRRYHSTVSCIKKKNFIIENNFTLRNRLNYFFRLRQTFNLIVKLIIIHANFVAFAVVAGIFLIFVRVLCAFWSIPP